MTVMTFLLPKELSNYILTHITNIQTNLKCNNFNFKSESLNTTEVHVGKCRVNNFYCGLCGKDFDELEDLEIHLRTCENE